MEKLPNHDKAIIPQAKIADYLLSLTHRDGKSKAKFFRASGFSPPEWETMAEALKHHAAVHKLSKIETSPFGMRYVIEGEILTPDNRNPEIRSVWFIRTGSDIPYFVTAYPL